VDIENEKQCSYCKEVKPKNTFYKNKGTKDGLDNYCRVCRLNRYREKQEPYKGVAGKYLKLHDFYPENKKWKRLETWNKYDATRLDELLYNGGDISQVFFMDTNEKAEWEKSKKRKILWKKKDK
jgi:hypothetical protein